MTNEAKECVLSALIIHTHAKSKKRPAKNLDYIVISIRQLNRADDDDSIKNPDNQPRLRQKTKLRISEGHCMLLSKKSSIVCNFEGLQFFLCFWTQSLLESLYIHIKKVGQVLIKASPHHQQQQLSRVICLPKVLPKLRTHWVNPTVIVR